MTTHPQDIRVLHRREREISLFAPAKVNLTLRILGRLKDGYHLLSSLICPISLGDDVCIKLGEVGGSRSVRMKFSPELTLHMQALGLSRDALQELRQEFHGPENIAFRAAESFLAASGLGFEVEIEKRVPFGAGLGGGSADAAAVLLGLWELGNRSRSETDLFSLAASLGADVPAMLMNQLLLMSGVGDRLYGLEGTEALGLQNFSLLLLKPPVPVPTQRAYELLGFSASENYENAPARLAAELKKSQLLQELGLSLILPPGEDKLLTLLIEDGNTLAPKQGNVAPAGSERLSFQSRSRSTFTFCGSDFGNTVVEFPSVLQREPEAKHPSWGPEEKDVGDDSFSRAILSRGLGLGAGKLLRSEQFLVNDFQSMIEKAFPAVCEAVDYLHSGGAEKVLLCGSGSSVIGCFSDARAAERAYRQLQSSVPQGWFMTPTTLCP